MLEWLIKELYQRYKETSYEGCRRKQTEKLWESLFLFLAGGGSCIEEIRREFHNPLPLSRPSKIQALTIGEFEVPEDVITPKENDWLKKNFLFFTVAYGLTNYMEKWRDVKIIPPQEVKPEPKKSLLKLPDIHDIEETR